MSTSKTVKRKASEDDNNSSNGDSFSEEEDLSLSRISKKSNKKPKIISDDSDCETSMQGAKENSTLPNLCESDSSDEDEPLAVKKSKVSKIQPSIKKSSADSEKGLADCVSNQSNSQNEPESSDENEPLVKKDTSKSKLSADTSGSEDSEDEILAIKRELSKSSQRVGSQSNNSSSAEQSDDSVQKNSKKVSSEESSSENENSANKKLSKSSSSSDSESKENRPNDGTENSTKKKLKQEEVSTDDEPLVSVAKKSSIKAKSNKKLSKGRKKEIKNDESSDDEKPLKNATGSSNKNSKKNASENRIEHIKKYIRAAGIRIKSYDLLFKDCRSGKSKVQKLLDVLQEKGIKGRPTLEKCKKLKKKLETEQEIAELDSSNILSTKGRSKRGCSTNESEPAKIKNSPIKKFSRLQDIIDSEESE